MPDHHVTTRDSLIVDVLKVMRTLSAGGLPPSQEDNVRAMLMAYLPVPRQGDLFEEPPREGNRLVKAAMSMVCGEPGRHDASLALAVKVAITVGHLRARRWDRLQASEALTIADALDVELPEGAFGCGGHEAAMVVPLDRPVEFMFPWRPGNARSGGLLGTSTSHVGLVEVDPVDAPVACSLRTPEGRLTVRRLGSGWLRPVLSSGSWRPITVTEFREAAHSGCAWSDNPFLPRAPRDLPTFHVLDVSGPQPLTAANARRTADALDACLASAGQLHVIDGIVHRPTDAPTAGVMTILTQGGPVTGPAWRAGDFASTRDMGTFGGVPVATWFNGVPFPDRTGSDDPDGCLVGWSDWIGVSRLMEARVRRSGGTSAPTPPMTGDLLHPSESPPCAPDIRGCLRVAAGMAKRLLPLLDGREGAEAGVAACVRLRNALAAAEAEFDASDDVATPLMRRVVALSAEVLDICWSDADPRGGMWDYVASLASYAVEHQPDPQLADVRF